MMGDPSIYGEQTTNTYQPQQNFMPYKLNFKMNPDNRTLYVGNLDHQVTEDLIRMLFGQLGEVRNCKMFRDPTSDPYCFVEFVDHVCAVNAITMMNDKALQGRKMRVDWATGQNTKTKYTKVDTSNHFHIYVGDLTPDIDEQMLKEAFIVFGEISDCKIVKDPQTTKSRGYGFVVFVKKVDAETAISSMNGQWLGRKMIKVRWATRKPNAQQDRPDNKKLTYEEVFNQASTTNTTVFCGGLKSDITDELLQEYFLPFGEIEKVKIFKEKGYAFIKYVKKEKATEAIINLHNSSIDGQIVRCSWGKDTTVHDMSGTPSETKTVPNSFTNGQSAQYNSQMGQQPQQQQQQMGYWPYYPQQMGYNQMGYNQCYGYQQPNPGYMWMGWGQQQQQQQQGWNGQPPQPGPPHPAPPQPAPPHQPPPPPEN